MATGGQLSRIINEQQRDVIKKIKEEAAPIMSKAKANDDEDEEEIVDDDVAAFAKVILVNNTIGYENSMHFQEKKNWSGELWFSNYPASIAGGDTGKFRHAGLYPRHQQGSLVAVIYVGSSVQGAPRDCAWLVAWNVPGYRNPSQPNQVYVEAGNISKYLEGQVNWDEIKSKVLSSSQESYYEDKDTGAKVYAEIDSTNHIVIPAILSVDRVSQ